jgi:hypothetical protein
MKCAGSLLFLDVGERERVGGEHLDADAFDASAELPPERLDLAVGNAARMYRLANHSAINRRIFSSSTLRGASDASR